MKPSGWNYFTFCLGMDSAFVRWPWCLVTENVGQVMAPTKKFVIAQHTATKESNRAETPEPYS